MQAVDELYGPFDWRLPESQAIYWAEMGRLHSDANAMDLVTFRRQIFQSMQMACRRGGALPPGLKEVTWDSLHFLAPNLELVPKVNAAYEEMIKEAPEQSTFLTAHKNFLKMAVYLLYVDGRTNQAAKWFNYLGKTYTNAFTTNEFNLSMDQWAINQITSLAQETDMDQVTGILLGMTRNEYLALIVDEDEKALSYHALAQKVWNYYQSRIKGIPEKRIGLPALAELRKRELDLLLNPQSGWLSAQSIAVLRTKLNLPPAAAPTAGVTNAPPASLGP
jgi:hypothetical protein